MSKSERVRGEYWRLLAEQYESRLKLIRVELAALVEDPERVSPQSWMAALGNENMADAECLQKAWEATEI